MNQQRSKLDQYQIHSLLVNRNQADAYRYELLYILLGALICEVSILLFTFCTIGQWDYVVPIVLLCCGLSFWGQWGITEGYLHAVGINFQVFYTMTLLITAFNIQKNEEGDIIFDVSSPYIFQGGLIAVAASLQKNGRIEKKFLIKLGYVIASFGIAIISTDVKMFVNWCLVLLFCFIYEKRPRKVEGNSYVELRTMFFTAHIITYIYFLTCFFILALRVITKNYWFLGYFVSHGAFMILLSTFYKKRNVLIMGNYEKFDDNFETKYFQQSSRYLTLEKLAKNSSKQNIQAQKLQECSFCLTEQSCIMYPDCGHICLCRSCCAQYLERQVFKCPICRKESSHLLEMEREQGRIFKIFKAYRFTD